MLKGYIFNVDRENLIEYFKYMAHNMKYDLSELNEECSNIYYHAYLTVKRCYSEEFLHRIHRIAGLIEEELDISNKYFAGIYTKMLNVLLKVMNTAEEWEEQEKEIEELKELRESEASNLD